MNKLNRDVIKSIKQIRTDMIVKCKKLFKDFKRKGIEILEYSDWNCPRESDFKGFGADAKHYMTSLYNIAAVNLNDREIIAFIDCPDDFTCVTKDELKKFETVTYPKLYAKWLDEQKQKRAAKRAENAKDASKIRAKIEKLQRQLDVLEA